MAKQFTERAMGQRRAARLRWYYKNLERAKKKHLEWIAKNKEKQVAYVRAYDKKYQKERKAKAAQRRKTHPTKVAEANRRSHAKHRESRRLLNKAWKAANPEANATYVQRRRTLLMQATGTHTTAEWRSILKCHGHRCAYCGVKQSNEVRITRDHYIPLSKGGSNDRSNIVPSCKPCNSQKNNRDPVEFIQSRGYLL